MRFGILYEMVWDYMRVGTLCMYEWFKFPDIQYLFGASQSSDFWASTVSEDLQRVLKPCSYDTGEHLYP